MWPPPSSRVAATAPFASLVGGGGLGGRRRWCGFLKKGSLLRLGVGASALLLLLTLAMFVANRAARGPLVDSRTAYIVTVDAGSSGSRVQIYRTASGTAMTLEENLPQWQHRVQGGLAAVAPADVATYIEPLLRYAQDAVPAEHHERTPLHLMATAGMRLLGEEAQRQVLAAVCLAVETQTRFIVTPCATHAEVISGQREGLFGWLALNFILGTLHGDQNGGNAATVGFLDLGGASAQISFEPTAAERLLHAGDLTNFTLDGRHFSVYAASFLGLGVNEARRKYLSSLPRAGTVNDPCLPVAFTGLAEGELVLSGAGNLTQCLASLQTMLTGVDGWCTEKVNATAGDTAKHGACLLDGRHAPRIDYTRQQFVGVSEYWHALEQVLDMGGAFTVAKLTAATSQFCGSTAASVEELAQRYGQQPTDNAGDMLQRQCFKAAWIIMMLSRGYGMPDSGVQSQLDSPSDGDTIELAKNVLFQSVDKVHGQQPAWTLGAAILLLSEREIITSDDNVTGHHQIDSDEDHHNQQAGGAFVTQPSPVLRLLPLLVFVLAGSCALIVRWLMSRQSTSSGVHAWLARGDSYRMVPTSRRPSLSVDLEAGNSYPYHHNHNLHAQPGDPPRRTQQRSAGPTTAQHVRAHSTTATASTQFSLRTATPAKSSSFATSSSRYSQP